MSNQVLKHYRFAQKPLPQAQYTWPLFGSGLDQLGKGGRAVEASLPHFEDDQLLMRIDAISLCFTDLKEIDQGENHPRLKDRDLQTNPIIPGHELSMTVVGVGSKLLDQYSIGQRFTIQPDVWVNGQSIPFCFGMDGAYRQYAMIDQRILAGDAGNYLIPIPDEMSYSAAAITEPWACVEAAYRMGYRTSLRKGGKTLLLGASEVRSGYSIDFNWLADSTPEVIYCCDVPADLKEILASRALTLGFLVKELSREEIAALEIKFDDLLFLDGPAENVLAYSNHLEKGAVIALYNATPLASTIEVDLGCLHYDEILYVGASGLEIADAYQKTYPRAEFKKDGTAWILGAGGPMGRMHLQRAIESQIGPATIIASEVSSVRLNALREFFLPLAQKNGKTLIFVNSVEERSEFERIMQECLEQGGVDDIEVMVTLPGVIAESCAYLAPQGVVNIFAGMKRGVKMALDAWQIIGEKQVRFVGHSGSGLDDQKAVVDRCISGQLDPNLSVAAIAGLNQIPDGVRAMKNSVYPGKIVIYSQILDLPLTGLSELKDTHPHVYALLGENDTWNMMAENALLESLLS